MNWLKKSSSRGIDEPQLPPLTEKERYRLAKPPNFRNSSIDLRNVSEPSSYRSYRSPSIPDEIRDRDATPEELRKQLRDEIFGREGSNGEEEDDIGEMSAYPRRRLSNISRSPSVESQHKSPASSTTRVDSVLGGSTSQLSLATDSGKMDLDNAINLLKELSKTLPAEDLIKLHKALLPNSQSENKPTASKEKVIRRRSLAQPGLATRNTYGEAVRIATTSSSEDLSTVRPMFRGGMFSQPTLARLSSIESLDERDESISPRAQTPAGFEYGHLGAHKIGSLVVTNGRAATPDSAWMLSAASPDAKEEDNVTEASAEQHRKFGGVTPSGSFSGNEYFPAVPPGVYELECSQSTIQSPTAEEYQAELQGNPFAQQVTKYIPYRPTPASHAELRESCSRMLGSPTHEPRPLNAIPLKMQRPMPDKADSGYSSLHSYHQSAPNLHMDSDDKSVYPDDEIIMQSIEKDEVPLPSAEIRPRKNSLLRTITSKKKLNRQSMPEIVPEKSERSLKSPEPTAAKPAPKRLQKARPASHGITVQGNRPVKTEIPPVPAIVHKSFLSRAANNPDMEHLHRTLAQSSTSYVDNQSEAEIPRYEVKLRFPTAKDDSASETDTIIRPNSSYFASPRDSVSPPPQSAPAPSIKLDLPKLEPMDFEEFAQSSGSYIGGSPYDVALQALTGEKPEAVVSRGPHPEPPARPPPQRPAIIQLTPKEPYQKTTAASFKSSLESKPAKPASDATRKATPTIEAETTPDQKRPDPAKRWSTDRTKLAERALARRNSLYGSRSSSPEKAESLSRTSSVYSYRESEDPSVSPADFIATAAPPRPRSRSRSRSKSGEPEISPPSVPSLPSPAEIKKLTKKASRISKDLGAGSAASSPGSKRSSLQGSLTSARPSPPRTRASVESFRGRQQSRPSFSSETSSLQAPVAPIAEEPSLPPRSVSPSMQSMLSQWEAKSSEPRHEPVRNPSLLSSRTPSVASRKEDMPANWQGPSKLWRQRRKSIGESLISKFKPKPVIPTVVVSRYMTPTQDEFPPWVPTEARMRATSGPFAPPPMVPIHAHAQNAEPASTENKRPALRRPMSMSAASSIYSVDNSSGDVPILDRYGGGLAYDYEHGRGFGGSAGTRQYRSEASRKSQGASRYYGVDLSDVPVIMNRG